MARSTVSSPHSNIVDGLEIESPGDAVLTASASVSTRRSSVFSGVRAQSSRRKGLKATRACDFCKSRKSRCSGTLPCDKCFKRGQASNCHYDAQYRRGRAVSPIRVINRAAALGSPSPVRSTGPKGSHKNVPPRGTKHRVTSVYSQQIDDGETQVSTLETVNGQDAVLSRASPELEVAEIHGQIYDTTSGLAFLHRAFRRFSQGENGSSTRLLPALSGDAENENSPTLTVGDRPIGAENKHATVQLPSHERAKELVRHYFDVCMASYRFFHQETVEAWLDIVSRNDKNGLPIYHRIGRAKAAILLTIFAIAHMHEDRANGRYHGPDEAASMDHTDSLFLVADALVQQETASPTLESAQARLIQVLYLLTTCRMNQAWYVFGTAIQLISALGLHRRTRRKLQGARADDFINTQCRRRTFWTAYIIDKYLGVIFGRPRHYNDDDIDQEMPDSLNDEDMTPSGPRLHYQRGRKDCQIDALIYHAKIAFMMTEASRTVYSIRQISQQDRLAAANRLSKELQLWRASLPPHLGAIRPSSLILKFRRQATNLKIAECHAIMHINRSFLLGKITPGSEPQISEAILAASTVLETVDDIVVGYGTMFYAFWWTHYVTFCALAIIYVWEIQSRRVQLNLFADDTIDQGELLSLAEQCQNHLAKATASNSPSRRYAIILEKLRKEAIRQNFPVADSKIAKRSQKNREAQISNEHDTPSVGTLSDEATAFQSHLNGVDIRASSPEEAPDLQFNGIMDWSLHDWQSEDWINLDSMAFGTFPENQDAPFL
ncbi:fungal-specific transcription factor domain-containing protein [Xylariaceae sp. FL1651]|nr:fungal-specific transcription factor domain-containing protein [Xylariaceae sp. FL1651]